MSPDNKIDMIDMKEKKYISVNWGAPIILLYQMIVFRKGFLFHHTSVSTKMGFQNGKYIGQDRLKNKSSSWFWWLRVIYAE